jgi:hypothetical protein
MNHVPKMNSTEFVDLEFFYNFCSLHFPVGHVSMIASPSQKSKRGLRIEALTVFSSERLQKIKNEVRV